MNNSWIAVVAALCAVTACRGAELDAEARKAIVREGNALLASGDFEEAVEYFAGQIREHPGDTSMLVWRAKARNYNRLRDQLDDASKPERQVLAGRKLGRFFLEEDQVELAEAVARKLYAAVPDARTAALLAEVMMATDRDADALALLEGVEPGEDLDFQIERGLALVRNDRGGDAEAVARGLVDQKELKSDQARRLGLLLARTGHTEESVALLTALFESLDQPSLESLKKRLLADGEWSFLASDTAFAAALAAKPRATGSCGGDCSSCGGCN